MALFGGKKNNENKITTDDILMGMATTRVSINPDYMKNDAKNCIETLLLALYSGDETKLVADKMTDEFYKKNKDSIVRDKNNGIEKKLYEFEIKNIKATNVDNTMMYLVTSVEFEIHYVVSYTAIHSTFDKRLTEELKVRYLFMNGNNYPNKKGWILGKECDRRELKTSEFDVAAFEYKKQLEERQKLYAQLQRQYGPAYAQQYFAQCYGNQQGYNNNYYNQQNYQYYNQQNGYNNGYANGYTNGYNPNYNNQGNYIQNGANYTQNGASYSQYPNYTQPVPYQQPNFMNNTQQATKPLPNMKEKTIQYEGTILQKSDFNKDNEPVEITNSTSELIPTPETKVETISSMMEQSSKDDNSTTIKKDNLNEEKISSTNSETLSSPKESASSTKETTQESVSDDIETKKDEPNNNVDKKIKEFRKNKRKSLEELEATDDCFDDLSIDENND